MEKYLRSSLAMGAVVSFIVFLAVTGLHRWGALESIELSSYDWFIRLRPANPPAESRIALVRVTEEDIQALGFWPLTDEVLTRAMESVLRFEPRALGIDIYRDLPVAPGSGKLDALLVQQRPIVWVTKFGRGAGEGIPPPKKLQGTESVGFNDIVVDPGGVVRRGLLFIDDRVDTATAFALRLALIYLQPEGIAPQPAPENPEALKLGASTLRPLEPDDGPYAEADARGYQFLLDFNGWQRSFPSVTLADLLAGKISAEMFRDKIVIIGVTAESVNDHFYTPFSRAQEHKQQTDGIAIHAHIASQLLRMAHGSATPIQSINQSQKVGWILLWTVMGTLAGLKVRSPWKFSLVLGGGLLTLAAFNYFIFLRSWWLPFVPAGLSWFVAAVAITACLSYREMMQRAALMHLFSRHVSKDVASAIWDQREQFLDGQRPRPQQLVATALFTDLVGFTSISEKMGPEQLMDWLNEYMEAMATQVGRYGGVIEQYSGDAIVAIFGIPIARKSEVEISRDAINAVECALSMEAILRNLNSAWRADNRPTLAMRIGIFTGPMVAGSLGSSDRMEYVVIGDTVNVASRLESFDKDSFVSTVDGSPCRILIGEATVRLMQKKFCTAKVGDIALKGKEEKISAYRVLGRAAAPDLGDNSRQT